MRKLLQISIAAILLITVACQKDEVYTSTDVTGKWTLKAVTSENGQQVTTSGEQEVSAEYEISGKNYNWIVDFAEDKTFSSEGNFTMVITTTSFGTPSDTEVDIPGWGRAGNWGVTENVLDVEVNGSATEFEIIEINGNTMKAMEQRVEESTIVNTSVKTSVTIYYTFEKVE